MTKVTVELKEKENKISQISKLKPGFYILKAHYKPELEGEIILISGYSPDTMRAILLSDPKSVWSGYGASLQLEPVEIGSEIKIVV